MKKILSLSAFLLIGTCAFAQLTLSFSMVNNPTCNAACNGSVTASATGGVPPYAFIWQPGNIPGPTLTNACAGTYTCMVTDQVSATATAVITLFNPPPLNVTATSAATCGASCTGTVTATASGGTPSYTYLWSPLVSNPNAVCAGTYTITVTDANGCTASNTTTVASNPAPTVTLTPPSATICLSSSVTITASGAVSYVWTPGNLTGTSVTLSPASTTTYTVIGTAANGCTSTQTSTITVSPASVGGTITGPSSVCSGPNNGVLTLSGHTGSVIRWEMSTDGGLTWTNIANVSTSQSFTNLTVNTLYRARVQSGACPSAYSPNFSIAVNTSPSLTSTTIDPTCNNANGSATVNATGNAPFMYNWLPTGGNNATATGLTAGVYTCDVTDAGGCSSTATVTLLDSCDYVWPGDANDDAVADNVDIIDIGIANGATGTTRANATTAWIGQPSTAWGQTLLSGTDYKFVDCDGNGAINLVDTQAVTLNYGYTHNNRLTPPTYTQAAPSLMISFDQDSLAAGDVGTMTLSFGDATDSANNIYGIGFRLSFDGAQLISSSFGITGGATWIGTPGNDMMRVVLHPSPANGYVDVAITRFDQVNASGFGMIGQMYFTASTALTGTGNAVVVPMNITNLIVVNSLGQPQPANVINDSIVVADSAVITSTGQLLTPTFSVYPNPANESIQLTINGNQNQHVMLQDLSGRVVYTQMHNAGVSSISTTTLPAGTYIMRVGTGGAMHVERIVIAH